MSSKVIRSFTASERELAMLAAVAQYHGLTKSGALTSLVKREFWRIFPAGNGEVVPDRGARIEPPEAARRTPSTTSKQRSKRS